MEAGDLPERLERGSSIRPSYESEGDVAADEIIDTLGDAFAISRTRSSFPGKYGGRISADVLAPIR